MNLKLKIIASIKKYFSVFVIFAVLTSCAHTALKTNEIIQAPVKEPEIPTLSIVAVGDNLIHINLIEGAKNSKDGSYFFDPYYSDIADLVQNADLAFINQETILAGANFGYSGYPAFNGPTDMAATIERLGFDVVNQASNHSLDKGEDALIACMDNWEKYPGITVLGIYRSQEDRDSKKVIIEKNNIKIGFLSYTYGTNGIPLPRGKPYLVSLIDTAIMAKEIDALRPLCDFLVVSMHWGNEYEHKPSKRQEELAAFLADHNVDLVIGHHPHVLQPFRYMQRKDGKDMLVFFSLGNFISSQKQNYATLGGMMHITIQKKRDDNRDAIVFNDAELIPVVTHYERGNTIFRVYLLQNYTDELALRHAARTEENKINIEYYKNLLKSIYTEGGLRR